MTTPDQENLLRTIDVRAALMARPALCSDEMRSAVLDGIVKIGMTPREAQMAGGGFFFAVTADRRHWPSGSDPNKVMDRQTDAPDNSRIILRFCNARQFETMEPVIFRVEFHRGRVSSISRVVT
jgi:hypothetical protein